MASDSPDPTRIRPAAPDDLPELVRIYNHYVVETPITFDTTPFDVDGRRPWFDGFSGTGPHRLWVAEEGGAVRGYASSSPFRSKPAYASTVETTIYLDASALGRGIGRKLYSHLLEGLRAEPDLHRAVAGITMPNPASVALHEELGFQIVGTFRQVGFKQDRYWDVRWYEKSLSN
jgi:phosphinothricin acetyltransferase